MTACHIRSGDEGAGFREEKYLKSAGTFDGGDYLLLKPFDLYPEFV